MLPSRIRHIGQDSARMADDFAPDTTVVITCFNYGAYLPEAVASVHAQPGPRAEVIVVDDGSTDPETHAVLDTLEDDVRLIRKQNEGLAAARNTGFEVAAGRYLLPLDADDRLADGALATLRDALDRDPT